MVLDGLAQVDGHGLESFLKLSDLAVRIDDHVWIEEPLRGLVCSLRHPAYSPCRPVHHVCPQRHDGDDQDSEQDEHLKQHIAPDGLKLSIRHFHENGTDRLALAQDRQVIVREIRIPA